MEENEKKNKKEKKKKMFSFFSSSKNSSDIVESSKLVDYLLPKSTSSAYCYSVQQKKASAKAA